MNVDTQAGVLTEVVAERRRQDQKWGVQNHDPITWTVILTEEVGEVAKASLEVRPPGGKEELEALRVEAIQCAAVAIALVECLDRDDWRWP